VASWLAPNGDDLPPSLHEHYTRFVTTKKQPLRGSLVLSPAFARPGGNLTGVNFFANELAAKRLALLHELVPKAVRIAVLVNPANPASESTLRDIAEGARAMGLQIQVLKVSTRSELEAAFATLVRD